MKKTYFSLMAAAVLVGHMGMAQTDKQEKKTTITKEVTVESKDGDEKEERTEVVIENGNVTINGKPAAEYKGSKKIIIKDGHVVSIDGRPMPPNRPARARVMMHTMDGGNKALLGVVTEKDDKGAKVKEVSKASAAEKAGLREGDVITGFNGKKIANETDLVEAVREQKPDDVADITYLRKGKEKKVKATLGKNEMASINWDSEEFRHQLGQDFNFDVAPPMAMQPPMPPMPPMNFNSDGNNMWLFRDDRPKFGMSIEDNADADGAKVTNVETGSNVEKAGIKKDDLITGINGKTIKGIDDLREELDDAREANSVGLQLLRNGKKENVTVKIPKKIKKADL